MKKSVVERNGVSKDMIDLLSRTVALVPWPGRRKVMGDIVVTLLDGKVRVAEDVFGWSRQTVELGMNELRTGITCLNDLSKRRPPKVEEKQPRLLAAIRRLVDPTTEADSQLRTALGYTNVTAKAVHQALAEEGWAEEDLPTVRTLSNLLNRHGYRRRRVAKKKVQKKRPKQI